MAGPPVRRIPVWLIPLAICGGFAVLFLTLFRDRLLPAQQVEVAAVLATASESATTGASDHPGEMLFQASGWIEPDPLPVKATALIDGVIDSVHVLEGQQVTRGELLATFVDEDFRLTLAAATENHRALMAALDAHVGSITSAHRKLEAAEATEKAALTSREEAADRHHRLASMRKGSVPELDVVSSRLQFDRERHQSAAAAAERHAAAAEIARLELETKVREAEVAAAAVALDQAQLAMERTRVAAPLDGRVLRLLVAPGQKRMLAMDDPDSSTVAILYQPDRLQLRVDVPLADASRLGVGQRARIRCSLLPDRVFDGEVTRITGEADVRRNTLQAKVRIKSPIDQLRPEMLCRVEFLGRATVSGASRASLTTWIPLSALAGDSAWVCDPETRRVSKRNVRPGGEHRDGFVRIDEGLRPGERIVLSPGNLRDGQRVNPTPKNQ